MPKIFNEIIESVCEELGISYKYLSFNYIIELKKGNKVRHIIGKKFDLNGEASGFIASDKYATYEVLNSNNIPVIKHFMLFNPLTRSNWITYDLSTIISSLNEGKYVIKPNNGSEGLDVEVTSKVDLENTINKLFLRYDSLSLCPFYDILNEYRVYFYRGEVKFIYEKSIPFVVGDGSTTLRELIKNYDLPSKKIVNDNLKHLDLDIIPKKDEVIELSWKFNLSGGAKAKKLEKDNFYKRLEDLAIRAGNVLNMNFATIDIIKTKDNEVLVLEVNSGVSCEEYLKQNPEDYLEIKNIYQDAICDIMSN